MRLLACLIVAPQRGYDEPAILSYAISSFCPTSADGLQARPPQMVAVRCATLNRDYRNESKKLSYARPGSSCQILFLGGEFAQLEFEPLSCRLLKGSERKLAPMTVSSPNVIEIKLDRLIDDMRLLRSQMNACDRQLKGIEASLKPSEWSEQQPESKSRPWFAAAASATARTVLFAVGQSVYV